MAKLVNWHDFELKIRAKKIRLFSKTEIKRLFGVSDAAAGSLLHRYSKKNFITRVKKGIYALPGFMPSELYTANKLYEPSYISLEFALSYRGVIPETVYEITSVTPKATRRFETLGKIFSYKKIKKNAFSGYMVEKQGGLGFYMADAEKAFVDTNYLRLLANKKPLSRFDKSKIDPIKVMRYASLFGNRKLLGIIKTTLS